MAEKIVGPFEVGSNSEWIRTAIGAALLIKGGEPILTKLAKSRPGLASGFEQIWTRAATAALGLRTELSGMEHVDPDTNYVVAPLHESLVDPVVLSHLPLRLTFLYRDELLGWKHLGRYLESSDHIPVPDRRDRGVARRIRADASERARAGKSLVVFPQGSILGIEVAFNSGAFRLADQLRLPLLPVVLAGGHRVWEHPFSARLRFGQSVSMDVLPPLEPGRAVDQMRATEQHMKELALTAVSAPARRFVPSRDGFWDNYSYEIDPMFSDLAEEVALHRQRKVADQPVNAVQSSTRSNPSRSYTE